MRYALLINELPGTYDGLGPEELQALTAEYFGIPRRPARRGRWAAAARRNRHHRADGRRPDPPDRRPVRRDEGASRRFGADRGADLDAAIEVAAKHPAAARHDRAPSGDPRARLRTIVRR